MVPVPGCWFRHLFLPTYNNNIAEKRDLQDRRIPRVSPTELDLVSVRMISLGIAPYQIVKLRIDFFLFRTICSDCNTTKCEHLSSNISNVQDIQSSNKDLSESLKIGTESMATHLPEVYDNDCQQNNKPVPPSSTNNINRPLTPKSDDSQSNCQSKCEFEFKRRGIHIANLNIRHLKPKVDNMKVLLDQDCSIDIFGLCETFLNDSIDNEQIHIHGFKFERKDRLNTVAHPSGKGGGILTYVAEHIDYS